VSLVVLVANPSFPHPDALELALRDYQHNRDRTSLAVVATTLDMMAVGGIHDPVEGGFFRYSTTRDWRIPISRRCWREMPAC